MDGVLFAVLHRQTTVESQRLNCPLEIPCANEYETRPPQGRPGSGRPNSSFQLIDIGFKQKASFWSVSRGTECNWRFGFSCFGSKNEIGCGFIVSG